MVTFGERFKDLREKAGYTQDGFSAKTEISQSYISRIESGDYDPSLKTIARVARAFGMTIAQLMEGVDVDPNGKEKQPSDTLPADCMGRN